MDGNTQDPGHLRRFGSHPRHRAGTPCRWPCMGLSAVAASLPLLLCLAMFSRSSSAEGGPFVPVYGAPGHLLGIRRRWPSLTMQVGLLFTYLYCINDCCVLYCTVRFLRYSALQIYNFTHCSCLLNLPRVEFKLFARFD